MNSLLSEEYRNVLQQIHSTEHWGITASNYLDEIRTCIDKFQPKNILDYGCGAGGFKSGVSKYLDIDILEYEPGRPELQSNNLPREFVVCVDVLEHIEPDFLENVLMDLKRVTLKNGFFTVCTRPAIRILPNGWNAHLIQESNEWWISKITKYFNILGMREHGPHDMVVIVEAKI